MESESKRTNYGAKSSAEMRNQSNESYQGSYEN